MTKQLIAAGTLFIGVTIAQLTGAQTPNHTELHGSVTDPSGAVIPSAMVVVSNGSFTRTVSTDEAGQYDVAGLPAGHYRVRVHFGGFAAFDRTNFVVTDGHQTEVNAQLELKEARQTVTVYE